MLSSSAMDAVLDIMVSLIESRSLDEITHVVRIRKYTEILLKCIYKEKNDIYHLTKKDIEVYAKASTFHDIGKILVSDEILLKKGKLSGEEMQQMKLHTIKGAELMDRFKGLLDGDYLKVCHDVCRFHHERWDGSGYPDGLTGTQIPFISRVVAIADVYDALTSVRLYRPRLPHKTAIEMIAGGECGMFDPEMLECFKMSKNKFSKISL